MNKIIAQLTVVFMLFSTVACSHLESTIKDDIQNNNKEYTELVQTIGKCDFPRFSYGQFIAKKHFPSELVEVLSHTKLKDKIQYIILIKNADCDHVTFELLSGRYHIIFNSCPNSNFPLPDSYKKEGFIETWGINNNWFIWKDNDFI